MVVVDFLVMFLSSTDDTMADTPDMRRPLLHMASLVQQLCRSWPASGWAVQTESACVKTSLLLSVPVREKIPGKFNFGVGTGVGVGMNLSGYGGLEAG